MPDLRVGSQKASTVKVGSTQAQKLYIGNTVAWENWVYKTGQLIANTPSGFSRFSTGTWNNGNTTLVFDLNTGSYMFRNAVPVDNTVGMNFPKPYRLQQVQGAAFQLAGSQVIDIRENGTWVQVGTIASNSGGALTTINLNPPREATGIRIRTNGAHNPWTIELRVTQWYEQG